MVIDRLLRQSAQRAPDAAALIEAGRTVRYGELDQLADRFANALIQRGVRRGDRVAIAIENSVEFVAVYIGTVRAGAVAVPLTAGPRNDRVAKAVSDATPVAAVIDAATAADAASRHILSSVRSVFVHAGARRPAVTLGWALDLRKAMAEADASPPNVRLIDQDLAAIIYTSGSTGEPRGVMLTHRNLVSNARSIAQYLRLTAADRVMCVLPFYYVYGLSLLHTHLLAGGSIVIDNRLAYPNVVVQGMRDHQVTGLSGVPSTFVLLLERSDLGQTDLPHLRYLTQAGGAMPVGRLLELRKRLPGVPVYVMYGATEAAARLTYLEPAMLESKLGSIGRSIPNVAVTILREDGSPASAGEVGELVARGSNISCGYWNAPDETAIRFGPQGYRTGDLGYMDDDGYLFLTGRRHDMIKTGAHRVGPREIEDVLCAHPDVIEAAVVGAPDDILGEIPVAFVSVRHASGLEPAALRNFCAPRLAAHKIPARWHFVPELPKTGAGKVDKVSLRDRLRDEATSPNV